MAKPAPSRRTQASFVIRWRMDLWIMSDWSCSGFDPYNTVWRWRASTVALSARSQRAGAQDRRFAVQFERAIHFHHRPGEFDIVAQRPVRRTREQEDDAV